MIPTHEIVEIQNAFADQIQTLRSISESKASSDVDEKKKITEMLQRSIYKLFDDQCSRVIGSFLLDPHKPDPTQISSGAWPRNRDAITELLIMAISTPGTEYKTSFSGEDSPTLIWQGIQQVIYRVFKPYALQMKSSHGQRYTVFSIKSTQ